MITPTPQYLAAPEMGRTRPQDSRGPIHVVVENFTDAACPFGKSMVYLSVDNGTTFTLLDWKVAWRSWCKKQAREWPPHDLYIEALDHQGLHVRYCETTYDGSIDHKAFYDFALNRWRL